jgi:RNA polymerase II transcription factor SIII (Elongin) subunit A
MNGIANEDGTRSVIDQSIAAHPLADSLRDPSNPDGSHDRNALTRHSLPLNSGMMEDDNTSQMAANIKLVDRNPFIPSLRTLAMQLCVLNANNFVSMGDLPVLLIEPILQACLPAQLARLEDESPHLRAETDEMWARHVRERFRVAFEKNPAESWRDVFERLKLEEGERLKEATARLAAKNGRIEKEKQAKKIVVIEPPPVRNKKRSNPFGGKFPCDGLTNKIRTWCGSTETESDYGESKTTDLDNKKQLCWCAEIWSDHDFIFISVFISSVKTRDFKSSQTKTTPSSS